MSLTTKTWGENTSNDYTGFEDSYMNQDSPGSTYGGNTQMQLGNDTEKHLIVKIDFGSDLSGLITEVDQIVSATLYFYELSSSGDVSATWQRLKKSWTESSVSWNSRGTAGAWESGGALHTNDYDSTTLGTSNFTNGAASSYVSADLTDWVKAVYSGTYDNHGLVGRPSWVSYTTIIQSSDNSDGVRPYLEIVYTTTGSKSFGKRPTDDYTGNFEDNFIVESTPNINNGYHTALGIRNYTVAGAQPADQFRTLIKTDISSLANHISASSEIDNARLYFYARDGSAIEGAPVTVTAHRLLKDWNAGNNVSTNANAGESSWDAAKEGTADWGTPGADNTSTDIYPSASGEVIIAGDYGPAFTYIDVTQDVKDFFDETADNYGWRLHIATTGEEGQYQQQATWSSEYTGDTSLRPYLEVNYTLGVEYDDTPSDGIELSDTGTSTVDWQTDSISDGITFSDTVAGGFQFDDLPSDGVEFTDSSTTTAVWNDSISDGIVFTDDAVEGEQFSDSRYEQFIFTDTTDGSGLERDHTASAGIVLTDSGIGTLVITSGGSEAFTFSDVAIQFTGSSPSAADDSVTFTDSVSAVTTFNAVATDGISLTDTTPGLLTVIANATDGIVLGDNVTNTLSMPATAADSLTLADAVSNILDSANAAADTFNVGDVSYAGWNETVADGLIATDSAVSRMIIVAESVSDGMVVVDTGTVTLTQPVSSSDVFTITDSSYYFMGSFDSISDGMSFGDTESAEVIAEAMALDEVVFTDSTSEIYNYVNVTFDGFVLGETVADEYLEVLRGIDGFSFSDSSTSPDMNMIESISDGVKLSEIITGNYAGSALTIGSTKITFTFVAKKEE